MNQPDDDNVHVSDDDNNNTQGGGADDGYFDAIIVGGGPVGLALAIGLAHASQRQQLTADIRRILVIEGRPSSRAANNTRDSSSYIIGLTERSIVALESLDQQQPQDNHSLTIVEALNQVMQSFRYPRPMDRPVHIWTPDNHVQTQTFGHLTVNSTTTTSQQSSSSSSSSSSRAHGIVGQAVAVNNNHTQKPPRRFSMQRELYLQAMERVLEQRHYAPQVTIRHDARVHSIQYDWDPPTNRTLAHLVVSSSSSQPQEDDKEEHKEMINLTTTSTTIQHCTVRAPFLFGCDGIHSVVRYSLRQDPEPSSPTSGWWWRNNNKNPFGLSRVSCPSAGLIYKSLWVQTPRTVVFESNNSMNATNTHVGPPASTTNTTNSTPANTTTSAVTIHPEDIVFVHGTSGESLTLLPHMVPHATHRPAGMARRANFFLYQPFSTTEQVYQALDREWPQLQARTTMAPDSVQAFVTNNHHHNNAIVFCQPAWCRTAATTKRVAAPSSSATTQSLSRPAFVALLGDALCHFPPDVGQGLQSGLLDVQRMVQTLSSSSSSSWTTSTEPKDPRDDSPDAMLIQAWERYNHESVQEAEAICRLMPHMAPYQYNLRSWGDRLQQFKFQASRWIQHHGFQRLARILGQDDWLFHPSPVQLLQQHDPRIWTYHEIWQKRQWNQGIMQSTATAMFVVMASLVWNVVLGRGAGGRSRRNNG